MAEAIALLREEMDKREEVEQNAASFLTNTFLGTYSHDGTDDDEDPTPSLIHDIPLDVINRVVLIVAGCALSFQQVSEEAYEEATHEDEDGVDIEKWEAYLDGVTTLTSGLMGMALAVADSATAAGEVSIEDFLGGGSEDV